MIVKVQIGTDAVILVEVVTQRLILVLFNPAFVCVLDQLCIVNGVLLSVEVALQLLFY